MAARGVAPIRRPRRESGFTLVEVLVAIVVLVFGLMAITNLFVIATSSNVAARHMTASGAQAMDVMERLESVPFSGLVAGGASDTTSLDTAAATAHTWTESQPIQVGTATTVNNYEADRNIAGLGTIRVRWQIVSIDNQTRLIRVVAASASGLMRARSLVELVTYRSCTSPNLGCPANP